MKKPGTLFDRDWEWDQLTEGRVLVDLKRLYGEG